MTKKMNRKQILATEFFSYWVPVSTSKKNYFALFDYQPEDYDIRTIESVKISKVIAGEPNVNKTITDTLTSDERIDIKKQGLDAFHEYMLNWD